MLSEEDKQQIEYALDVETKTVVEEHFKHYLKVLLNDYLKLLVISDLLEKYMYDYMKKPTFDEMERAIAAWKGE